MDQGFGLSKLEVLNSLSLLFSCTIKTANYIAFKVENSADGSLPWLSNKQNSHVILCKPLLD
jgi:hypothetical protein